MRGRYDMPEWLLWVSFVVVMLPVAALCLALIYALMLIVYLKLKHLELVTCDAACKGLHPARKKEADIEIS